MDRLRDRPIFSCLLIHIQIRILLEDDTRLLLFVFSGRLFVLESSEIPSHLV